MPYQTTVSIYYISVCICRRLISRQKIIFITSTHLIVSCSISFKWFDAWNMLLLFILFSLLHNNWIVDIIYFFLSVSTKLLYFLSFWFSHKWIRFTWFIPIFTAISFYFYFFWLIFFHIQISLVFCIYLFILITHRTYFG